jgi:ankyrin repeat protein
MQEWLELLKDNNFIGIKKYIKTNANLEECDEHGESVLASAIKLKCDNDIIDLLIDSGADVHAFDDEGVSILDFAINGSNFDLVKRLCEEGVDINKTSRKSKFTALMAAVCYNEYEMDKFLIEKKVNIDARDSSRFTAYTFAKKMRKKKMLDILIESGATQE